MNKTIFITGASSGIGYATANYFQEKGWNVVATMRNPEDGKVLAEMPNVMVAKLDVTDYASASKVVADAVDRFGTIDVLVNNAGYAEAGPLEASSMENIQHQFDVNVFGLLAVTKAVLPIMREKKNGTIVNISSIGGRITLPFFSLYHGTKFAVEGITESLQYELGPLGIKVRIVEPGAIATDFAGRSLSLNNDESLSEYQETLQRFTQEAMKNATENSIAPVKVAEVIDQAIHGEELRYLAGDDAKQLMQARSSMADADFLDVSKQRFGLS